MDELLDVVNEKNIVIGRARYSVCHAKGLLHRGVVVFVFKDSKRNEILVQKRNMKVTNPGKLNFPGGHVISGKSTLQAIRQEAKEELGLSDANLRFTRLFPVKKSEEHCNMIITLYSIDFQGKISLNRKEVESNTWMKLTEVAKMMKDYPERFTFAAILLFKEYHKRMLNKNNIFK